MMSRLVIRQGIPPTSKMVALFATMTLGGLWHGAGLTFVAWGAAHGFILGLGVLWRKAGWSMPSLLGWALTFLFVMMTWVLFRATSFEAALRVYEACWVWEAQEVRSSGAP